MKRSEVTVGAKVQPEETAGGQGTPTYGPQPTVR